MENQVTNKEKTTVLAFLKTVLAFLKTVLAFLKWVSKNCTARSTSRNNIWANYWQLNSTGVLYKAEELFDYWDVNIKDNA